MFTKPVFLTYIYVKRQTDVRKKNYWLIGQGLFADRPADTVRPLPSDRRLTLTDNPRQKRRIGYKSAQWTRALHHLRESGRQRNVQNQQTPTSYSIGTTVLALTILSYLFTARHDGSAYTSMSIRLLLNA